MSTNSFDKFVRAFVTHPMVDHSEFERYMLITMTMITMDTDEQPSYNRHKHHESYSKSNDKSI
jgi:hypothetical protein